MDSPIHPSNNQDQEYKIGKLLTKCWRRRWGRDFTEGLPGVLGNKGTLAKYRREQGNISQFLGAGEQNSKKLQYENILRECGNMGTQGNFGREQGNKDPPPWETLFTGNELGSTF